MNPIFVWVQIFINGSTTASLSSRVNLRDWVDGTVKIYAGFRAHRIKVRIFQHDSASGYRIKGISVRGVPSAKISR